MRAHFRAGRTRSMTRNPMNADTNPRGSSRSTLGYALAAAAIFAIVLAAGYGLLSRLKVPDYGAWTGIRPLETKLHMLQAFARQGDVDAIVIGSSIVDFGFSAELLSDLMSKAQGRPYRAFNFATGGAEPRTLPKLYRLARTVSRPKNVFVVVPAEQKLREEIYEGSPDFTLRNAPVGDALNHSWLLSLNRWLWSTPILRNAPATRDFAIYGQYRNLQAAVGMEVYALNEHGDRESYLMTWKIEDLPRVKGGNEAAVRPFPQDADYSAASMQRMLDFYFARTDSNAFEELRGLVEGDGGKLHLIAHAGAATLWGGPGTNADYSRARRDFFKAIAWKLGAPVIDPTEAVNMPTYDVSDVTHLNVYGARAFTRAAFAALSGRTVERESDDMQAPPAGLFPTTDATFNQFAALVRRPANQAHPLLHFQMVNSSAVPPLPTDDLFVALRTPEDIDIVVPAIALGTNDFVAEVKLPPNARAEGLVLRLLAVDGPQKTALSNPLANYEWLTSYPRLPPVAAVSLDTAQLTARERAAPAPAAPPAALDVLALPPSRVAGESLYIALRAHQPVPPTLGVRLAPLALQKAAFVDLGAMPWNGAGLLKVTLPATLADGEYDIRIHDPATGVHLGQSQRIQVFHTAPVATLARVAPSGTPRVSDGSVQVAWSGVRKPDEHDWIGLFPVGGRPDTRLDIVFTRGMPAGEMRFPLSPAIVPKLAAGDFEFRLYAAGGWRLLAQSERFAFDTNAVTPPRPAAVTAEPLK
jgi:hypothetical protein